ncbi:VPLPA-CTERM sorting domain-containing protein [Paracoccus sp. SSK6]|uniref:VPLPA-CTERM sorting domain-containing protein n=1 Tax=Paracoccus sp. SSK6 TaxID=3143131 RepID=UPI00321A17F6
MASITIGPITTSSDADEVLVNWTGASYGTGSTATFDIGYDIAPVPLPAGLPLLAAALGSLIALRRKRTLSRR